MPRNKKVYDELKASGLCPQCGVNKPEEGRVLCPSCLEKFKATREYKRAHKICVKCGSKQAAPGRVYCDDCLQYYADRKRSATPEQKELANERSKKRQNDHLAKGLCRLCSRPVFENHTYCYEHLMERRVRARRARALAKECKD